MIEVISSILSILGFLLLFDKSAFIGLYDYFIKKSVDELGQRPEYIRTNWQSLWHFKIKIPLALTLLLIGEILELVSNFNP